MQAINEAWYANAIAGMAVVVKFEKSMLSIGLRAVEDDRGRTGVVAIGGNN